MTLVNRAIVLAILANGEPLSRANNRGVGNTTAAILLALSTAIKNPGEAVAVKDTVPPSAAHHAAHTCQAAKDMINRLGLDKVTAEVQYNRSASTRIEDCAEPWLVLITSTFAERM